jgi:hypothetical protein
MHWPGAWSGAWNRTSAAGTVTGSNVRAVSPSRIFASLSWVATPLSRKPRVLCGKRTAAMALARTTPCTVRQATQLRGPIHALVLMHVTVETGGMAGLGQAYALHKGSSVGQAPGSSASCAWPMASRRRGSSFLQFTMTFWAWTASTASSGTTKSPAFST